jgi:hypothetical protein
LARLDAWNQPIHRVPGRIEKIFGTCHAPLHLGAREVLVPVVDRLELAAVNRDAGLREQAHRAAQRDEAGANLADGAPLVLAEIGDRLVVWSQAPR